MVLIVDLLGVPTFEETSQRSFAFEFSSFQKQIAIASTAAKPRSIDRNCGTQTWSPSCARRPTCWGYHWVPCFQTWKKQGVDLRIFLHKIILRFLWRSTTVRCLAFWPMCPCWSCLSAPKKCFGSKIRGQAIGRHIVGWSPIKLEHLWTSLLLLITSNYPLVIKHDETWWNMMKRVNGQSSVRWFSLQTSMYTSNAVEATNLEGAVEVTHGYTVYGFHCGYYGYYGKIIVIVVIMLIIMVKSQLWLLWLYTS